MNITTNLKKSLDVWRRMNGKERQDFLIKVGVVVLASLFLTVFIPGSKKNTKTGGNKVVEQKVKPAARNDDLLLGATVDQKSYVQRMETQYFAVTEKSQILENKVSNLSQQMEKLTEQLQGVVTTVSGFDQKLSSAVTQAAQPQAGTGMGNNVVSLQNYSMEIKDFAPMKKKDRKTLYLPAGSFVRGTLLTGVYAPSDQNNPLPVLIRLNEAFTGPNEARIPLEGAFAIGKATGDLTSERALIQVTLLSSVFTSGQAFEEKGNLGYITDIQGQLGLRGVVIRNTGTQLAMSFMTGFMGGASQALADAETTSTIGVNGQVTKTVVGSGAKNAAFQGAASSATKLSDYYNKQLENIVPAIRVDSGVEVVFIVMQGVKLYGLSVDNSVSSAYLD